MTTKIISVLLSLCIMCSCSKSPSKNFVKDRLGDTSVETGKEDNGNKGEISASEGKDCGEQHNSNPHGAGLEGKILSGDNHGGNNQVDNKHFYSDWGLGARISVGIGVAAVIGLTVWGSFYVYHIMKERRIEREKIKEGFDGFNVLRIGCGLSMLNADYVGARYGNNAYGHEAVLTVAGHKKRDEELSSSSSSTSSSLNAFKDAQHEEVTDVTEKLTEEPTAQERERMDALTRAYDQATAYPRALARMDPQTRAYAVAHAQAKILKLRANPQVLALGYAKARIAQALAVLARADPLALAQADADDSVIADAQAKASIKRT